MVSKETGKCVLTTSESEVEPAACLALEMRYALDPNRQIKKRNKALQVRFKDICEAQNEQRDSRLAAGQPGEKREAKPVSYRAAYRKYMTVPARRAIPNVTKSTGVQTSPDLKKCYQTFPLDRKKGNLKSIPAADAFKSQNNGFVAEKQEEGAGEEARPWGAGRVHKTAASVFHSDEHDGQPCAAAASAGGESRQIVPHTEVVDLKAQLQVMEDLISSSQETIKVLLGVIQELEKGEAHREGLSYRTGQDTANCETCRNSACVIYSVELDFKQQEDKLQPVLRKLHPFEETQVVPSPYSQEPYSATPKQKSKPESKKHGRWKLWFL
ncbi:Hypothetical predicted protein [Lynx pardinus]|uniref:Uncharacterized protein n=1 Tax=Lynx pardinus TaxID=191816 RepID=A0A485NC25_LYNPA|nr:Hypothetical predicted protein [Lynx pardinus]